MIDESSSLSPAEVSAGWSTARSLEFVSEVQLSTHICSYYRVDIAALKAMKPTILLTTLRKPMDAFFSEGPGLEELKAAIMRTIPTIRVIHDIDPMTISEIYAASFLISMSFLYGEPIHIVRDTRKQLARIARDSSSSRHSSRYVPLRVAVVQWDDPIYLAAGWIPEAISIAGGVPSTETVPGGASVAVGVSDLLLADVVVFAICAVDLAGCSLRARKFTQIHASILANSRSSVRLVAVDASVNFSRPTLSALVGTTQLIADIINNKSNPGWTEINRNMSKNHLSEFALDSSSRRGRT